MVTWCKACDGRGYEKATTVVFDQPTQWNKQCVICSGTRSAPAEKKEPVRVQSYLLPPEVEAEITAPWDGAVFYGTATARRADEPAEADAPVVVGPDLERVYGIDPAAVGPVKVINLPAVTRVEFDANWNIRPVTPPEMKADQGNLVAAGLNKPRSYRWEVGNLPQRNVVEMKLDPVIADLLAAAPVPTDAQKEACAAEAARLDAEWYGRTVYPAPMKPDPDLADLIGKYFDAHVERLIAGQSIPPPAKYPEACIKSTPGGWAVYPADNRDGMVLGMFPLHADAELFLRAVRGN